jgi:CDP-diacylglycerol pyrophosphatase
MRSIMHFATFPAVALGLLLSDVGTSEADVQCGDGDRSCLSKIVQGCVGDPASGQCASVDPSRELVVLKALKGSAHYLVIPTRSITGIEEPAVQQTTFPDYWSPAWEAAERYVGKPREWLGLAINSAARRSQDQLHVHVACVREDVKTALEGRSDDSWAKQPVITLQKHDWVRLFGRLQLRRRGHFRIIAERLLLLVEAPVVVPVATGVERAQLEDGLGTREIPACAGDAHAVLDQVSARALDHAGRDGKAGREECRVIHEGVVAPEVRKRAIDLLARALGQPLLDVGALGRSDERGGAGGEEQAQMRDDPLCGDRLLAPRPVAHAEREVLRRDHEELALVRKSSPLPVLT